MCAVWLFLKLSPIFLVLLSVGCLYDSTLPKGDFWRWKNVFNLKAYANDFSSGGVMGRIAPPEDRACTTRLAFASCNRQMEKNEMWRVVEKRKPQALLLMGDNVYADDTRPSWRIHLDILFKVVRHPIQIFDSFWLRRSPSTLFSNATPEMIKDAYNTLAIHRGFAHMKKMLPDMKILATWDDHDFGINDGDRTYEHRDASKQLFLDFFDELPDSPRRSPKYPGVYSSHFFEFGGNRTVKIYLLDTRYNKDPWSVDSNKGDILGYTQWAWLENEVHSSAAAVNIFVSSMQVLPQHRPVLESWSRFPAARRRLLNLIIDSEVSNPIVLSGDVHFSEMLHTRSHCLDSEETANDFAIWEFTSSGMTHSTFSLPVVGPFIHWALASLFPAPHTAQHRGRRQVFSGRNIGELEILWNDDLEDGACRAKPGESAVDRLVRRYKANPVASSREEAETSKLFEDVVAIDNRNLNTTTCGGIGAYIFNERGRIVLSRFVPFLGSRTLRGPICDQWEHLPGTYTCSPADVSWGFARFVGFSFLYFLLLQCTFVVLPSVYVWRTVSVAGGGAGEDVTETLRKKKGV